MAKEREGEIMKETGFSLEQLEKIEKAKSLFGEVAIEIKDNEKLEVKLMDYLGEIERWLWKIYD